MEHYLLNELKEIKQLLKRLLKQQSERNTSRDEETITNCGYGCNKRCSNCKRKGHISKNEEPTGSKMFENLPEYQAFIKQQNNNFRGRTAPLAKTQEE